MKKIPFGWSFVMLTLQMYVVLYSLASSIIVLKISHGGPENLFGSDLCFFFSRQVKDCMRR